MISVDAFWDELEKIAESSKEAGMKDVLGRLSNVSKKSKEMLHKSTLKALAASQHNKYTKLVVDNLTDPMNVTDIGNGIANMSQKFM